MSQSGILNSSLSAFSDLITVLRTDGSILTSGVYTIGDLGAGTVVVDFNSGLDSSNVPFRRGQSFSVTVNSEKYFTAPVVHPIN